MEILEGHNKFYVNDAQGNRGGDCFVPTGEHLSIIEHTDVDPSLKGRRGETAGGEGSGKMRRAAEDYPSLPVCQT